jgi:hypothetical protein
MALRKLTKPTRVGFEQKQFRAHFLETGPHSADAYADGDVGAPLKFWRVIVLA